VDWEMTAGWGKPRITPYEPIKIDTTATSLHYGISAFEGISIVKNKKAFWADNNLKSLVQSSEHLDLPQFD
jgi:branched-chain amino acid aminotransferase